MYLISTGKQTILSDFQTLETKSKYEHANGETTDFQCYTQHSIFVEVNKKSGLELMRIKEKEQKLELQRVRKLNIDNVYSVACAKQSLEEIAVGLVNGHVKLYNYKTGQFVHRFNADNMRRTVLFMDYNISDEYIAAVFESGLINIYGIKTKTKFETINIDDNSTLARFHPSKRFQLSIASYKGAVSVYDMQAKRKTFHSTDCHASPCRDLCMSAAAPTTLISVGYDCLINIFDIRRKTSPLQLTYCHPLSTVAMSDCGTYFCVGNLKGELVTYDMRNTSAYLQAQKVHECAVTRVAFAPTGGELNAASFSSTGGGGGNQTVGPVAESSRLERIPSAGTDLRKSIVNTLKNAVDCVISTPPARGYRDSFCDFLDFQANKGLEKMSSRFTTHRDSFDWEALTRKNSGDEQRGSLCQIGSGLSSISSANNSLNGGAGGDSFDGKLDQSFVNTNRRRFSVLKESSNIENNTQDQSTQKIEPKQSLDQLEPETLSKPQQQNHSDKENPKQFKAERYSTPHRPRESMSNTKPSEVQAHATISSSDSLTLSKQITELRLHMQQRLDALEAEIKLNAEVNKWQIYTHNFNISREQSQTTEEIREALGVLLQTDPFVSEFMRVKQENEMLKAKLLEYQQH